MIMNKENFFGAVIVKKALELQLDEMRTARDTAEQISLQAADDEFLELFTISENLNLICKNLSNKITELDADLLETRNNVPRETMQRWRAEFKEANPEPKKTVFLTNETAGGTAPAGGFFAKKMNGGN